MRKTIVNTLLWGYVKIFLNLTKSLIYEIVKSLVVHLKKNLFEFPLRDDLLLTTKSLSEANF